MLPLLSAIFPLFPLFTFFIVNLFIVRFLIVLLFHCSFIPLFFLSLSFHKFLVFESPVPSGLLTLRAQDRDRDRSIGLPRLPKTGPNRCGPVQCGLLRSFAVTRPVLTSYG